MPPMRANNVDPKWDQVHRRSGGYWVFGRYGSELGQVVKAPNADLVPQRVDGLWWWVYPDGYDAGEDDTPEDEGG